MAQDTKGSTTPVDDNGVPEIQSVNSQGFQETFGESLREALDPDAWQEGADLFDLYAKTEQEILDAVRQQDSLRKTTRENMFRAIETRPKHPKNAGVWRAEKKHLERVHNGLLFNGGVEVCDGTSLMHDSLPLTIAQLAIYLVSYNGSQGSWAHRVYRRDMRMRGMDPYEELIDLLEHRRRRTGVESSEDWDSLTQLARRGIMSYMERAILMQKSDAVWRMGHGNPAPFELLTGSGYPDLVAKSLDLLNDMLAVHKKVVFVPSAPAQRMWLTIGDALQPWEFAILDTLESHVDRILTRGHFLGEWTKYVDRLEEFKHEVASKIVLGVYLASEYAPAHLFYAHEDYAFTAALIAIADSMLQQHRGFPLLIDLADTLCRATFGMDTLGAAVQSAYTRAGAPLRYIAERESRR